MSGDVNYRKRFSEQLARMVKEYGVLHYKFDGYNFICTSSNHDHEQGSETNGAEWTSKVGNLKKAIEVTSSGVVQVGSPQVEALFLIEGEKCSGLFVLEAKVNGADANVTISESSNGWNSSLSPAQESWSFIRIPLVKGINKLQVTLDIDSDSEKISAWVWAFKSGSHDLKDIIPQPELISLDSECIIDEVETSSLKGDVVKCEMPMERIKGVYLDSLKPESATQGWGMLQKPECLGEAITIGGIRYMRGIGTHANARIVYNRVRDIC